MIDLLYKESTKELSMLDYKSRIEGQIIFDTAIWRPISFVVAAVVVLFTVYIHSYKASRINPVDALRHE